MACNAAESWYANLDDFSYAFIWCEHPQVVARPATRYRSAVPAQPARAEVPAVAADPENGIEGVPFQPARLAQPAQPEVPDLPKILAEPAVLENQNMSAYLLQEFQEVASLEVAEQEFIPFRTQRANQSCREFCFKLLTALPKYHEVKFTEELREGEAYAATRDRELLSVARSGCIKIFKDYLERLEIVNPEAVATFAQFQEAAKTFETKTVEGRKHYNNAKPGPEVKHAAMASLVEVGTRLQWELTTPPLCSPQMIARFPLRSTSRMVITILNAESLGRPRHTITFFKQCRPLATQRSVKGQYPKEIRILEKAPLGKHKTPKLLITSAKQGEHVPTWIHNTQIIGKQLIPLNQTLMDISYVITAESHLIKGGGVGICGRTSIKTPQSIGPFTHKGVTSLLGRQSPSRGQQQRRHNKCIQWHRHQHITRCPCHSSLHCNTFLCNRLWCGNHHARPQMLPRSLDILRRNRH